MVAAVFGSPLIIGGIVPIFMEHPDIIFITVHIYTLISGLQGPRDL
jgi:hypothetical protein